jgi:hypothetical protein
MPNTLSFHPKHLLSNKVLAIYVTNMLHCMEMGLVAEGEGVKYITNVVRELSKRGIQPGGLGVLADDTAAGICTSQTYGAVPSGSHSTPDLTEPSNYCGTVYAFGAFAYLHPTVLNSAMVLKAKDSKANVSNYRPSTVGSKLKPEDQMNEQIKALVDARGSVPFITENKAHFWIAPLDAQPDDAESARNKLGLDHIPQKQELSYQRLVRLGLRMSDVRDKGSLHRPTVLDSPSPRFRAYTHTERGAAAKPMSHGMTVDLSTFQDGYAELVAKFHEHEFSDWALTDLGLVEGKHPHALEHDAFLVDLNRAGTKGSAYHSLCGFSSATKLDTLFPEKHA